jgi:hypothetical protein
MERNINVVRNEALIALEEGKKTFENNAHESFKSSNLRNSTTLRWTKLFFSSSGEGHHSQSNALTDKLGAAKPLPSLVM